MSLLLIRNADVYAPEPRGLLNLLVAAGQVIWLGPELPRLPSELALVEHDAKGQRLIPGFIDGHAHTTGGGGEAGFASRVPPVPLSLFTRAGVTTVVGLLGTDCTTRDTAGLLAQTRGLREQGLNALCHTGGYQVPPVTLTGSVRGDIIHLDPVIGVGEVAISDHRSSQPTLDELLRIAADAHVAGLTTGKAGILHLHLGDGRRGLDLVRQALDQSELPPRTFNPTHVNRNKPLFEQALELAGRGCTVDITAFPPGTEAPGWSAADALELYLASSAPADRVTVSSDGGGCLPAFDSQGELLHMDIGQPDCLLGTLADLLHRGHALAQVLPAFTSNVADLLRLHDRGRIAVGHAADLVQLAPDHSIRSVLVNGVWHRRDDQQLRWGRFETPADNVNTEAR